MTSYSVREARPSEMDEIYHVRYEIFYREFGVIEEGGVLDGKECDALDNRAHHIVSLCDDMIVGYTRLIHFSKDTCFPIEKSASIPTHFDRTKCIEVSRGLVVPSHRKSIALQLLMDEIYRYGIAQHIPYLLSFSNDTMMHNWEKRGVRFSYIGEPLSYYGHRSWPLVIEIASLRPRCP